jgi:hypothetical protein
VLSLLVVYSDRRPRGRLHHLLSFVFAAHVFSSTAAARQPAAAVETQVTRWPRGDEKDE